MRALSLFSLTLLGALCGPGVLAQASPDEAALSRVSVTREVRPGVRVPGTPDALNASVTLRYGAPHPRAVLLLMPGYLGGAGSFDRLARQIVALDPSLAVWAVDRRANLLEDQAALARSDRARLETLVRTGLPVRPARELGFLRDWGLDTTLRDWRAAVLEARALTPEVFIGGHSMGAGLAGMYAAYDFDGQAGYRDVRGLVMLDGTPDLLHGREVSAQEYRRGFWSTLGPIAGLDSLNRAPYVDTFYYGPKLASRADAQAQLAQLFPQAPAPPGGLTPLPATNLAAAMMQLEQRYALLPFLTVRTGKATNTLEQSNPLPRLLGAEEDAQTIVGPQSSGRLIGWREDPLAPTDASDFVSRFWTPLTDMVEWYFPQRLTLDVSAASADTRGTPMQALRVWHTAEVTTPVLGIAAEAGVTRESDYRRYGGQLLGRTTVKTLPDAAHLDIVTARGSQVARWVLEWMNGFGPPASGTDHP
ncbi:alpha/beta hydrolase [Deinococcus hohokamensis]|uniref:Alpha/beta hydrolase n=1 Tax=Deinococcus hohokamensis TaxID=309883 RepID=A0ABV9I8A5_9DEIO